MKLLRLWLFTDHILSLSGQILIVLPFLRPIYKFSTEHAVPFGFCVDIGAPKSVIGKCEPKSHIVLVKNQRGQVRRSSSRFI